MTSQAIWVVVADGASARFLIRERAGLPLRELEPLSLTLQAEERRKGRSTAVHDGVNTGPLVQPAHQNIEEDKERHFLGHIAGRINLAVGEHAVGQIVLIAPPHALGLLRARLSGAATDLVKREIGKDLVRESVHDIERRLKSEGI